MSITKPISICWNITSACNLTCEYCYRVKHSPMISSNYWNDVILKIVESKVKRLVISGGEPLLVPNIGEILTFAKSKGLIVSLITNGFFLKDETITNLIQIIDEIVFSIDGTLETHIQMRGITSKDFCKIFESLQKFTTSSVRTRINTVVCSNNLKNIINLGDLLLNYNIQEWRLLQFYPMNDAGNLGSEFKIPLREFYKLRRVLKNKFINSPITLTFGDNKSMSGSYFSISPNGEVFTSKNGKVITLGHILNDSIESMCKSPFLNNLKHSEQYSPLNIWNKK